VRVFRLYAAACSSKLSWLRSPATNFPESLQWIGPPCVGLSCPARAFGAVFGYVFAFLRILTDSAKGSDAFLSAPSDVNLILR